MLSLTALQRHLSEHCLEKRFHPDKGQKLIRTEVIRRQAYMWNNKEKPLFGFDAFPASYYMAGERICRVRDENNN